MDLYFQSQNTVSLQIGILTEVSKHQSTDTITAYPTKTTYTRKYASFICKVSRHVDGISHQLYMT